MHNESHTYRKGLSHTFFNILTALLPILLDRCIHPVTLLGYTCITRVKLHKQGV